MGRIISIITFFNPNMKNVRNALRIINQSDETIICDNSKIVNSKIVNILYKKVIYYPNYENLGLSAAFNKILFNLDRFKWDDNDFICFFDQDSSINYNHIKILMEEYNKLEKSGYNLGCIGPIFYDKNTDLIQVPRMHKKIDAQNILVDNIMTSSMLCKYRNLRSVNFWNEKVFLDMADWDICWRLKQKGLISVMTKRVILSHCIGDGSKTIGLIKFRISSPIREYYQTRDCMYLLKMKYVPLKYKIRFLLQITIRPILHIIFLNKKKERCYYVMLGINDYINKIYGPISDDKII